MYLIVVCSVAALFLLFEKRQDRRRREEIEEIKTRLLESANLQSEQYIKSSFEEIKIYLNSLNEKQKEQDNTLQQIIHAFYATKEILRDVQSEFDKKFSFLDSSYGKGAIGEWQLENILKSLKVNNGLKYFVQANLKGGRPDCAVPVGKKYLYIDSKNPFSGYAAFCEDPSKQNFQSFISAVRRSAEDINNKYVSAEDSIGISVLFLPSENMMLDILKHSPETLTEFGNRGVFILSPLYLPYFLHMFTGLYSSVNWENSLIGKKLGIVNYMTRINKKIQSAKAASEKADSSIKDCERLVESLSGLLNLSTDWER